MGKCWYFAELCGIIEVMEEKNYGTIRTEMIESLRAENKALKDENAELSQKVEWLMEQLRLLKKKQFGTSSEQGKGQLDGQLSFLFNEAEAYTAPPGVQKTTQVAAHTRKQSGSVKDVVPETIPVEVVEHRLSEEERVCPQCGELMREIGTEARETLKLIPAKAILRRDVYYTYACENCEKNDVSTPIMKAPKEPSVIPGSFASAQAIAHIMTQKFVMASPLYRQEQEWARQGLKLSRQTMSNWVLRAAEDHLLPVYEELRRQLVKREVLHADETTLQVLHEPGKRAQTKSYMWLYRTGREVGPPIVLYEYQPSRKAEHAEKFLEGFSGYLHADGYQGYHKLPGNIRVVGCWAHARRKFDEALNALPPDKREGTAALTGLDYCNKLFAWEERFKDLSPEERTKQRLKEEKPILDALLAWANSVSAAPKSALGKALHYLKEQWPYLIRYLEDGRLELSNNRAERSIKPFVIGRKNFLFANTPLGAQASAVIYSLIETAKEAGLDPFRYLTWVLATAPTLDRTVEGWAVPLLPANAPEFCSTT